MLLLNFEKSIWNVTKHIFGKNNMITNKTIYRTDIVKIYYPAGSSSPSKTPVGGAGFYAKPNEINGAVDVTFSYDVKFDNTFQPVLGGKLPGLFINKANDYKGGSGGKHTNNTSCRIAWRPNFVGEAYVYLPKDIRQGDTYYKNVIENAVYGDSVWRGEFQFYKQLWNNVELRIKLNTFNEKRLPNTDGILELSINNKRKVLSDIIWTIDPDNKVETIIFETFFGGSSPKAVTPNDTWSYFKNVTVFRN